MMNRTLLIAILTAGCTGSNLDYGPGGPGGEDGASSNPKPGGGSDLITSSQQELKGGTRLKAKIVNGADGSQAAIGLYDTKFGVDCAFQQAADGQQHCLPTAVATSTYVISSYGFNTVLGGLFSDSQCSHPLAVSNLCDPPVSFIRFTTSCGGPIQIADALPAAAQAQVYVTSGSLCESYNVGSLLRLYTFGAVHPPTDFVAGTLTMQ